MIDILRGGAWHGANSRDSQPWRLTLGDPGAGAALSLIAIRSSDGWRLAVTDDAGRFDGPFVDGDLAGELVEYFEELIADVVDHDLLPAEALAGVDLSEIERLAMTLIPTQRERSPGEWTIG